MNLLFTLITWFINSPLFFVVVGMLLLLLLRTWWHDWRQRVPHRKLSMIPYQVSQTGYSQPVEQCARCRRITADNVLTYFGEELVSVCRDCAELVETATPKKPLPPRKNSRSVARSRW